MARVMSENSYAIEVQADFLKRQAKAKPLHAGSRRVARAPQTAPRFRSSTVCRIRRPSTG